MKGKSLLAFGLCFGVILAFGMRSGGSKEETPPNREAAAVDPDAALVISGGERVDVYQHLTPGRRTVIEFTAGWCKGSGRFAEYLDRAMYDDKELRVRTIDIDQWRSPVALQYGISKLPAAFLYDGEELVSEDYREILRILLSPDPAGRGADR